MSISPNGALGLRWLGVMDAFLAKAYAPEYQCVRQYKTGRVLAHVPRGDRLAEAYGERYYVIHRADLHAVLADAVRQHDANSIVTDHQAVSLEQDADHVSVQFANGRSAQGAVLIGADGVRSLIRNALFGPEEVRFTGYVAWRGLVPMDRVPVDALEPPSQVWIGPGHMINRYPVSNGKLLNFVAFAERSGWEEEGWNIPATVAELRAEFEGWHPHVTAIIDGVPEDKLFKWALCARSAAGRRRSPLAALSWARRRDGNRRRCPVRTGVRCCRGRAAGAGAVRGRARGARAARGRTVKLAGAAFPFQRPRLLPPRRAGG